MKFNPLLITALAITSAIAAWGLIDTAGLAKIAGDTIKVQFSSRAWFIMLTVSSINGKFATHGLICIQTFALYQFPPANTLATYNGLRCAGHARRPHHKLT